MNKRFNSWATHLPLLAKVIAKTRGSVLELGPGLYSTPVISMLMAGSGREYLGVDTDLAWIDWIKNQKVLMDPTHKVEHVSDYKGTSIWEQLAPTRDALLQKRWGVVFLDCFPDEIRYGLLQFVRERATVIVCHDTSPNMDKRMGLRPLLESFKHRYTYNRLMPWTDVVSDQIDVNELVLS